jgi:hypothetical protein
VVAGQEWFGDGIEAIRTGQATDWVAEGVDNRIERVYRLERQGRHFEAGTVTGDTLMNGYYVGRATYGGVRGGVQIVRDVRANGFTYTVQAQGAALRSWALTYEGVGTGLRTTRGTPGIEPSFRASLLRRALANDQPPATAAFNLRNLLYRLGRPNPGRYQSFLAFEDLGNGRVGIARQLARGADGDLIGEPLRWEVPLDADPVFLGRMLESRGSAAGGHHNGLPGIEPPSWVPQTGPLLIRGREEEEASLERYTAQWLLRIRIVRQRIREGSTAPVDSSQNSGQPPASPPGEQRVPGSDRQASDSRATGGTNTR